jgi:hypothetical protein
VAPQFTAYHVGPSNQFGEHGLYGGPGARRQQQRRLTRPVDAGHHGVESRTPEPSNQQGFADRAAAQATHVEGVFAYPKQAVLQV